MNASTNAASTTFPTTHALRAALRPGDVVVYYSHWSEQERRGAYLRGEDFAVRVDTLAADGRSELRAGDLIVEEADLRAIERDGQTLRLSIPAPAQPEATTAATAPAPTTPATMPAEERIEARIALAADASAAWRREVPPAERHKLVRDAIAGTVTGLLGLLRVHQNLAEVVPATRDLDTALEHAIDDAQLGDDLRAFLLAIEPGTLEEGARAIRAGREEDEAAEARTFAREAA